MNQVTTFCCDPRRSPGGTTLVELVVVMSILGIIAAVAAIMLRDPISAYGLTVRRAELVDIADTALRRMGRDIRLALPNSLRIATSGSTTYLELLTTKTGGRYRAQQDNTSAGDILNFSAADTAFDTLGPMSAVTGQTIAANDILVVQNLFATAAAQPQSNAYTYNQAASNCTNATPSSTTCNTARITGPDTAGVLPNERHISFDSRQFPLTSPGNRFNVVSGPVTYVCSTVAGTDANGNGTGTLTRISNYTITLAQPQPPAGTSALLAKDVTACQINYDQAGPSVVTQNRGLVSMKLSITRGGETVTLYHEVHVDNVP